MSRPMTWAVVGVLAVIAVGCFVAPFIITELNRPTPRPEEPNLSEQRSTATRALKRALDAPSEETEESFLAKARAAWQADKACQDALKAWQAAHPNADQDAAYFILGWWAGTFGCLIAVIILLLRMKQ